jgi:hypothetical protein
LNSSIDVKKTEILSLSRIGGKLESARLAEEISSIIERDDQYVIMILDEILSIIYGSFALKRNTSIS